MEAKKQKKQKPSGDRGPGRDIEEWEFLATLRLPHSTEKKIETKAFYKY